MVILGLNMFHGDASAALIMDGKLVAAVEEERFRRVKHWSGFPTHAISYCLREAGMALRDVDQIAINQDSKAHLFRKLFYAVRNRPDIALIWNRFMTRRYREDIPSLLARELPGEKFGGTTHHIEHHLAHLSSAFHVSPFQDSAIVSVDGFGDFASSAWGVGHGVDIAIDGQVFFPHSLGIFYQAMTQYLGFPNYGDEYKVMGLAPYGNATMLSQMRRIVHLGERGIYKLDLSYFRHHKQKLSFQWQGGTPSFENLYSSALVELLGPSRKSGDPLNQKHFDLARSVQAMYEEAFFNLIGFLQREYGLLDICLAGGCAMNSVANGKIRRNSSFRRVYVQSAAGDAGGAIGAGFAQWFKSGGKRNFVMDHAYWGPHYGQSEIADICSTRNLEIEKAGCNIHEVTDEDSLCREVATAVADGKVVGWFQGRMEWGPRALGNRSIICDPRRADMKDILNNKIKRRESFRPFAPSILEEAVADWFEEDDAVPFMTQVFQIRKHQRPLIPAVTHVDGSGRLQTVYRHTNPRYYMLIEKFRDLTGVPMVLNTSFNENEPVVCNPAEALDCFLRTRMDLLVLGNVVITRLAVAG